MNVLLQFGSFDRRFTVNMRGMYSQAKQTSHSH